MNVSAKAVVLEVLSAGESIDKGTLPVRSLVQAASVFDIAENSVRVAIVRLRAEGLLESPGRGARENPATRRRRRRRRTGALSRKSWASMVAGRSA